MSGKSSSVLKINTLPHPGEGWPGHAGCEPPCENLAAMAHAIRLFPDFLGPARTLNFLKGSQSGNPQTIVSGSVFAAQLVTRLRSFILLPKSLFAQLEARLSAFVILALLLVDLGTGAFSIIARSLACSIFLAFSASAVDLRVFGSGFAAAALGSLSLFTFINLSTNFRRASTLAGNKGSNVASQLAFVITRGIDCRPRKGCSYFN